MNLTPPFLLTVRLRNPTYGLLGNWYVFDYFQYVDRLMAEVGLASYRKSWWKEQFQPLLTEDLKGLKDEYLRKYGGGEEYAAAS
jgi:hypothetical protein